MFDHCGLGVVRALGINTHIWLSTTPLHDFVSVGVGVPSPLSYVPVVEENYLGPKMGFWERANNVYEYFIMLRLMNFGVDKVRLRPLTMLQPILVPIVRPIIVA